MLENLDNNMISIFICVLKNQGKTVLEYTADDLFKDNGYELIQDIALKLQLDISNENTKSLHSKWLKSTRDVYYNYFNKQLII